MKKNNLFYNICLATTALSITDCESGNNVQEAKPPNILLIFTDQQNADAMSIAGNDLLDRSWWELADFKPDPARRGRMVRTADFGERNAKKAAPAAAKKSQK